MNLFIDTSSLAKRYVEEKNSDKVDDIFLRSDSIEVSHITRIEINSAFARRLSDKSINEISYNTALLQFLEEYNYFNVAHFNANIETESINLIKKYQMKTLDSIQLASVKLSDSNTFVTSDKKLYDIAVNELKIDCIFL